MDRLYDFDKSTVVSRLNRWGKWKMQSGVANGYPSRSAFMREAGGNDMTQRWDRLALDSECVQTDKAVECLPWIHFGVIRVEYVLAYKETAAKAYYCGVKKRRYYEFLAEAHEKVANELNLNLQSAHKNDINMLNESYVRPA